MPGTHIALLGLTFFCAGALAQTDATPSPAPPSSPAPALTAPEPAPAATPAPGTEPEVAPTPAPADDAGNAPVTEPIPAPDGERDEAKSAAPGAAIEEAEEMPPITEPVASHPDVWTHLRAGFALPDLDDSLVSKHEAWYAARPDYVARMVERSSRYLYFIVAEIEKRGMPLEVALLPMIESAYNPMAFSRSRASGIWQFIPSTGKLYGLQQNWWFDARRDVVAATNGALDYLQKLHDQFGDWQLAFAAYNWGEGAVSRAIEKNRRNGKPTDYLSLKMPAETRNYLPKLQAVKNIVKRPEAFGLTLASIPDAPYFTTVQVPAEIDVKLAAELAEMPLEEFMSLNPAHNRPVIAGGDTHLLLLPYDKAELFSAKLALNDQPLVSWRAYTLRAKDRIDALAARCGLSVAALKAVNGVTGRKRIPAGYTLLIPVSSRTAEGGPSLQNAVFRALPAEASAIHRVRRGETLYTIASEYGLTQQQLRVWNRLRGDQLSPGMRLRVSEASSALRGSRHTTGSRAKAHRGPAARRTKAGKTRRSVASH